MDTCDSALRQHTHLSVSPSSPTLMETVKPDGKKSKKGGMSVSMSVPRLFGRKRSNSPSVFTVSNDDVIFQEDPATPSSSDRMRGMPTGRKTTHLNTPQISLLRRTSGYENDVALLRLSSSPSSLPSASPLSQLSINEFCCREEDTLSLASSMDLGGSPPDTGESDKSLPRMIRWRLMGNSSGEVSGLDEGQDRTAQASPRGRKKGQGVRFTTETQPRSRHLSQEDRVGPSQGGQPPLSSLLSQSLTTLNLTEMSKPPGLLEGPQGQLFTATFFNRIGRKGTFRNIANVNHVYKGTILVTDLLAGKILLVAGSGRIAKDFVVEPGSEPWCATITPRGHVAVTLRRLACVTVWSGNGSLVREFGHDVLQCPTGLACDRYGRFIVSNERTNLVAFFSASGEFLRYLSHRPTPQQAKSKLPEDSKYSDLEDIPNTSNDSESDRSSLENDDDELDEDEDPIVIPSQGRDREETTSSKTVLNRNPAESAFPTKTVNSDRILNQATDDKAATVVRENGAEEPNNNDYKPYVFSDPRYTCVTGSGKILVSDSGTHSVKVFNSEGTYLHSIGSFGSQDGQLKVPYGVCCDQQENVYIADHYNDRICVFSIKGTFLQHALTAASGLYRPKSLAVRPAHVRKLYIAHGGLRSAEVLVYRLVEPEGREVSFQCDL